MTPLEIFKLYCYLVSYAALYAVPIWFFGDTLLWVAEQKK